MKSINTEVKKIFSKSLGIPMKDIKDSLSYAKNNKWDSLNHMKMIALIEKKFKLQFEMKDVIAMETFIKTIKIINKYLKKSKKK